MFTPALLVSFGGDTKSRRSLLYGVYDRGSKYPTSLHWKCVTCCGLHHPHLTPPHLWCRPYSPCRGPAKFNTMKRRRRVSHARCCGRNKVQKESQASKRIRNFHTISMHQPSCSRDELSTLLSDSLHVCPIRGGSRAAGRSRRGTTTDSEAHND